MCFKIVYWYKMYIEHKIKTYMKTFVDDQF